MLIGSRMPKSGDMIFYRLYINSGDCMKFIDLGGKDFE